MCICCNKSIPKSTSTSFILRPNSCQFINGISDSYEIKYFPELQPYVDQVLFTKLLEKIIDNLSMMWSCPLCFCYGYSCAVCTLGLSFLGPYTCISQAVQEFQKDIDLVNKNYFHKRHIHLSLQRKCCTSWLQIDIMEGDEVAKTNENNNNEDNLLCKNQIIPPD